MRRLAAGGFVLSLVALLVLTAVPAGAKPLDRANRKPRVNVPQAQLSHHGDPAARHDRHHHRHHRHHGLGSSPTTRPIPAGLMSTSSFSLGWVYRSAKPPPTVRAPAVKVIPAHRGEIGRLDTVSRVASGNAAVVVAVVAPAATWSSPPPLPSPEVRPQPFWRLRLPAIRIAPNFGEGSLRAAVRFSLPLIFGGLMMLFLILQTQIGRRDPKLANAPIHRNDGGVRFV